MADFAATKIIIEKGIELVLFRIRTKIFIAFINSIKENQTPLSIWKEINDIFL